MRRLEECMMDFSVQSLKGYLGEDLVDILIEWTPNEEQLINRKKLIDMILSIHGNQIFKDEGFRRELLEKMSEEELLELGKVLGMETDNLQMLIECASKQPWKDNAVSQYIIKVFQLDEGIFEKQGGDVEVIEKINNTNRFYELLDYQYYIKQRLINFLEKEEPLKRILVQMPTGTGKTKTTMHTVINYYIFALKKKGLIIWMAHTTELLEQAYRTFKDVWEHLGDGEINVYQISGKSELDLKQGKMEGIAFCGISKLIAIMKNKPGLFSKLAENCCLIVFDEAHKAAACETSKLVKMLMEHAGTDRTLIGLTATPGRTTAQSFDNQILSNMFENRLLGIDLKTVYQMNASELQVQNTEVEDNIIQYFQKQHVLAKIRKEELVYERQFTDQELAQIKVQMRENGYRDFNKKTLELIGKNKSRNFAIMDRLRILHQEGYVTIVFTCSVEQAKLLSAMLTLEDISNALVTGDMSMIERQRAIHRFKDRKNSTNIIINYEVLTTGFDATNINCVFIARPTQSVVLYSQMIGRGLRGSKMGGNDECLLIDVKDNLEKYNEKMAFTHFEDYWKV